MLYIAILLIHQPYWLWCLTTEALLLVTLQRSFRETHLGSPEATAREGAAGISRHGERWENMRK
jgi:hypothetical protein